MSGQPDSIVPLIFAEVNRLWTLVQQQGSTELFGPAPGYFLLQAKDEADWTQVLCRGPILRQWRYSGAAFEECAPTEAELDTSQAQEAFYPYGVIQFHIRSDRQKVVFTYIVGPRYARGVVFRVRGEDGDEILERDPDTGEWVS
jgi:hypothetical protein